MTKTIKLALIQEKTPTTKTQALSQTLNNIKKAAAQSAELIVLQELHTSPYFCQVEDTNYFDLAESIPGHSSNALCQLAKELNVIIDKIIHFNTLALANYETNGAVYGVEYILKIGPNNALILLWSLVFKKKNRTDWINIELFP